MNMSVRSHSVRHGVLILTAAFSGGCAPQATQDQAGRPSGGTAQHDHEHSHGDTGPHGGSLVELGRHQYHAELLHDEESQLLTIHLLNSEATSPVEVDPEPLLINVTHNGTARQFQVAPLPSDSDAPGKTSRFQSQEAELLRLLDEPDSEVQLVVTIDKRQYRGRIEHAHP